MSRLITKFLVPIFVLAAAGLLASSCSDDSAPRSTIIIDSINDGKILNSDLYNNGQDKQFDTEDDYIVEDQVVVQLRNRAHDAGLTIDPNGPFGAVVFYRYEVRFRGDESLPTIYSGLHLRVPAGTSKQGEIVIVPASYKTAPPLLTIRQLQEEIRLEADITFIGEEEDSEEEVRVTATLPVHCADWADE